MRPARGGGTPTASSHAASSVYGRGTAVRASQRQPLRAYVPHAARYGNRRNERSFARDDVLEAGPALVLKIHRPTASEISYELIPDLHLAKSGVRSV